MAAKRTTKRYQPGRWMDRLVPVLLGLLLLALVIVIAIVVLGILGVL